MAALSVGWIVSGAGYAQEGENLWDNSGFESGEMAPWTTYGSVTAEVVKTLTGATVAEDPVEGEYCLHIVVPAAGANFWDAGLQHRGAPVFEQGKKYTLSAFFKCSSGTMQVNFKPEHDGDPWTGYGEQTFTMTDTWQEFSTTTPVFAQTVSPADVTFHVQFAAGDFWVDGARFYEGDYVPPAFEKNYGAKEPSPADGATDVPRETALNWLAGPFAATHDVYLAGTFEDANDASVANPLGAAVNAGLADVSFEPGLLEFGETYYWRVDEVNAAPDPTIYKGGVWSFTVEPYAYPITGIKATASSASASMGPEKTVDGSGLSADGLHSSQDVDMWLSAPGTALPAWIQYELDSVYKLHDMTVWNSNQKVESFIGFGAKGITIEYSRDGTEWSTLGDVELARAVGSDAYAGETVDLAGIEAKFVRLTVTSNWGGMIPQTGLSEVRFMYIPVQARPFAPAVGAEGQPLDTTLVWRPGREAVSHEVLFSDDVQAVTDGTAPVETVDTHKYQPDALEYGKVYYWKVNELGDDAVWEGDVWSFTTTEFAVVDDMESYNDDDNRIYDSWIDGWVNDTGSQVGYDASPFAERSIVHTGGQSMPLQYNNAESPFLSEAEHAFSSAQDWTAGGADTLTVYFQGAAPAFVETASGSVLMNAVGTDIWDNADQFRFAYKTLNGNGSMVARVDSIFNSNAWAKGGVMIRQNIEPGSMHAFMPITPGGSGAGNGASFQHRLAANGASTNNDNTGAVVAAPYWVKIERNGNSFTGSISPDGTTWTALGTPQTITMTGPVLIGLALTSHDAAVSTGAEFSNISATGNVTGAWQVAGIGAEQPEGNSVESLYVTVKDSAGKSKTVVNPDAAATARTGWQEWRIPLSEFSDAGVKVNAVKSMTIGVGNKAAPAQGGAGIVYVDDVRVGRYVSGN
jgi:hypothetical protein